MIVGVKGIGWVTPTGIGRTHDYEMFSAEGSELQKIDYRKIIPAQSHSRYGRMDKFSKLGITAISLALKDAGLDEWKTKRPINIIASTVYGCLGTDLDYYDTMIPEGGALASPSLFAYTLSSSFLGEASICFGLTGNSFVINEYNLKGLTGLRTAIDNVTSGESEIVVTGVCDLGCPEFMKNGLSVLPCAIFLVIERISGKEPENLGVLNVIEWDSVHFNGKPISDLFELVKMCLDQAQELKAG